MVSGINSPVSVDEILVLSILAPLAETDLSSEISSAISCTDAASLTGGGASIAEVFKDKSLLLPEPVEDANLCRA